MISERVNVQTPGCEDVLSLKQLFLGQVRASAQLLDCCATLTADAQSLGCSEA